MPIPEPPRPPIKPRERDDPKAEIGDGTYGGYYTHEEFDQLRAWREERLKVVLLNEKEAWEQTPQGKLCLEIYRKFQEYKKLLEEDRTLKPPNGMGRVEYPEHELFTLALESAEKLHRHRAEKSRQNLEKARMAARCQHVFLSGERCRAPRVRGRKLCRMHEQVVEAKTLKIDLGALEDPDSIQLAIQKLLKAIVDGTVEPKTLSYVTNLLQVAAWNVTRTRFGLQAMEEAAEIG